MKALVSVVLNLLCSWSAFGHDLTFGRIPAMAASLQPAGDNQDSPAATKPAPTKVRKSHKGLWITIVVVAVAAVVKRFHNEGAI